MRYVSEKEWDWAAYQGHTGVYSDWDGTHPEWKGRRTIMTGEDGPGTILYIEGVSFEIVSDNDPRCPKRFQYLFTLDGWLMSR